MKDNRVYTPYNRSNPEIRPPAHIPSLLKQGMLNKRGRGLNIGSPKNWKKRYFTLSSIALRYYEQFFAGADSSVKPKGELLVSQMTTVEEVKDYTFEGRANIFQIVYRSPPNGLVVLYVQCDDKNEWIREIRALLTLDTRASKYHPSYFDGTVWVCCKHQRPEFEGCRETTKPPGLGIIIYPYINIYLLIYIFARIYNGV